MDLFKKLKKSSCKLSINPIRFVIMQISLLGDHTKSRFYQQSTLFLSFSGENPYRKARGENTNRLLINSRHTVKLTSAEAAAGLVAVRCGQVGRDVKANVCKDFFSSGFRHGFMPAEVGKLHIKPPVECSRFCR